MIKKLLQLISGKSEDSKSFGNHVEGLHDLESFVDYVVKALVDSPEEVRISSEENSDGGIIKITCKKEDIGKIVGKKGKTIMSIRSLVSGAAGRLQKRVTVEVVD